MTLVRDVGVGSVELVDGGWWRWVWTWRARREDEEGSLIITSACFVRQGKVQFSQFSKRFADDLRALWNAQARLELEPGGSRGLAAWHTTRET